jgi:hypothetical protein
MALNVRGATRLLYARLRKLKVLTTPRLRADFVAEVVEGEERGPPSGRDGPVSRHFPLGAAGGPAKRAGLLRLASR